MRKNVSTNVNDAGFCPVDAAELSSVEGGFINFVIAASVLTWPTTLAVASTSVAVYAGVKLLS